MPSTWNAIVVMGGLTLGGLLLLGNTPAEAQTVGGMSAFSPSYPAANPTRAGTPTRVVVPRTARPVNSPVQGTAVGGPTPVLYSDPAFNRVGTGATEGIRPGVYPGPVGPQTRVPAPKPRVSTWQRFRNYFSDDEGSGPAAGHGSYSDLATGNSNLPLAKPWLIKPQ